MAFPLCRVINLEDFQKPVVRDTIREIFTRDVSHVADFPDGRENRKQWEIAMAVLALGEGGALRPDAEVLGIGAGTEGTLFWLTNHVGRVWATDLYAAPGAWTATAVPTMLTDPGTAWPGPWNPRRLVVQHMDACNLAYEDETFDAIFSSGSIEHFGSIERVETAMDEAFRTLKPGGTASFSTEFLIEGDPLMYEDETVMFTPELIERVVLGNRAWALVTPIDYAISDATLRTEIDIDDYTTRSEPTYPHCVLRIGPNLLTSVHIALRKAPRPTRFPSIAPRAMARLTALRSRPSNATSSALSKRLSSRSLAGRAQSVDGVGRLPHVSAERRESSMKRVARRLARPMLSPIDGRVGDINRRIEHTRAFVERDSAALEARLADQAQTLDAYARGSAEACSYLGVELRRVQETLEALETLHERALEEYYEMRLERARDLPLEKLDGALADAINNANGSDGFFAQAGLFFNEPVWVMLSQGTAAPVQVNERIVEVPFAVAALSRLERGARILDVGSAESTFPLSAASLGYDVTAIDPRPLALSHPNLESFACLLEDWDAPTEPFAAVFLISTIEHVGLGAYGEPTYGSAKHGAGADLALLDRVRGLLPPEGLMILTTPYGTREVTELERIYDEESLTRLLAGWEVLEKQIVVRRDAFVWEPDDQVDPGARGVVMVIAQRQ
jgi:SAM-dependent methyltransferase